MRRMQEPNLILALLCLTVASAATAQQADPAAPIPLDPAVRAGRLDNGLRYFIRSNTRPAQRAELMLVVNAGSVLEDEDQLGLAHMVEHMAFNGTTHFAKQELVGYLESIGMRFGADLNAYTGFDETVYLLTVPTDTGTALERGMQILEDWSHNVTFDSLEVSKERGVVIEEWRSGQGAGARIRDKVFPVLFRGSRYADRLPIGTRESLEGFEHSALLRFYRDWYRPDLMAVIAVGDFDVDRVESMIRQRFSGLRSTADSKPRGAFPATDHAEPLVVVATDPEATGTSVNVYYRQPVASNGTYRDFRRSLVENLYNGMLNARLEELARQAEPPFVGAGSSEGELVRTHAAYSLGASVSAGGELRGLEAVLTEGERVARHGFTTTELEREKSDLLRFYETAFAERDKTESNVYANEYARHFLQGEAVPGITLEFELVKQYLPVIALGDVNALATEWMTDRNRVVVVQAPEKDSVVVPDRDQLLGVFAVVERKDIAPYEDVVAPDALVPVPPQPGTITGEQMFASTGVTEWRLSNGVRVLLRPTDFKDDEVLVRAFSPGGLSLVADADYTSGGFSPALVQLSGYGDFDATQLQKALAGKAVGVQATIDDLTEGLNGAASPKDLETLFQLIYLNFTALREDSVAFQSIIARFRAILENQEVSPEKAFADTLAVTLAQHHPRVKPVSLATLDDIDRDRAFDIFRDRFAGANEFTFVIVGTIDTATIRPLVLRWLGGLPTSSRTEKWVDNGVRPPEGVITKVVRKGIEPKSQTSIAFTGPFEYTRESVQLLNSLSDVLEIRLRDLIREELGGTYGVQVSPRAARDPWSQYSVTISFGAAPERLDSLVTVVFEEIARLSADGPDEATLQKVKETQRREHETNARQNSYWVGRIASAALQGYAADNLANVPALIDAVNAQGIAATARQLLRRDRYVRVSLMPER